MHAIDHRGNFVCYVGQNSRIAVLAASVFAIVSHSMVQLRRLEKNAA